MAGLTELSKTTDPVEILRILQEEAYKAELPKSEQQGLLTKPTISKDDESYGIVKFIADWWTDSEEKVKEARKEVLEGLVNMPTPRLPQPPVPDELMDLPTAESEPVIEGVPEQPEMLVPEPYELVVDTIGNEALDRSGMRLVDVTDTEKGKLSNEEPLYKMAEEIDPGTIETKGLMSKPDGDSADGVQPTNGKDFVDSFVTAMGKAEGTKDHTDSLGIKTLGYGILPATAKNYGFDPDSEKYKNNRKALAKDVYTKMNEDAVKAYPKVFEGLTDSQKVGVLSMYINLGELSDGVVTALSKDTPDFDEAKTSLAKVVLGSPRNEDGTRQKDKDGNTIYTSSKGLSKRRAKEYNTLMAGQADFKPVKTVAVEGTKTKPIFVWKDKDGNEIHRYEPSISGEDVVYQGLDKNSNMKAVSL
jgi:hypothetical protein